MNLPMIILFTTLEAISLGMASAARASEPRQCANFFASHDLGFNSPVLAAPINARLNALLVPKVFDKTRLIMMEMPSTDLGLSLLGVLRDEFASRLAKGG